MDGIIKNPTNELMEPMHAGKTYSFPPDHVMQVPGKAAGHILNEYGQRGLVQLNYGDNSNASKQDPEVTIEEYKSKAGLRKNKQFKTRQVEVYNQDNEARRGRNDPFVTPTDQVKGYAKELGLDLLGPYTAPDNKQAEVNALVAENADLKGMMKKLMEQNQAILANMNGANVNTKLPTDQELAEKEMVDKFCTANQATLRSMVQKDHGVIVTWPENVKTQLRERYQKITGELLEI